MSLFSQRKGIRPMEKALQFESIDIELRNRLWTAITAAVWDHWSGDNRYQSNEKVEDIVTSIWVHYFKKPIDTVPLFKDVYPHENAYEVIRKYFFECEWWQVYDFIEFLVKAVPDKWREPLKQCTNQFLEAENAAYRIVEDEIVEITDEQEIEAVETAIAQATQTIRAHITRALELLSDKNTPDYRNSIKESISAVESAGQWVTQKPSATLGDCLKTIEKYTAIHPAFKQALDKLYGFSNDEGGIRHALTENSLTPTFADAKFMLVICSAFVNFLHTKASELNIKLS